MTKKTNSPSRLDKTNVQRQKLSKPQKVAYLLKLRKECLRGLRGGVTQEELEQSLQEAVIADTHEQ